MESNPITNVGKSVPSIIYLHIKKSPDRRLPLKGNLSVGVTLFCPIGYLIFLYMGPYALHAR